MLTLNFKVMKIKKHNVPRPNRPSNKPETWDVSLQSQKPKCKIDLKDLTPEQGKEFEAGEVILTITSTGVNP